MGPVIVKVDDRLAETGDTLPVSGHLEEDSYSLGDHVFELPEGIDYDLMLTNAGEGILATGILPAATWIAIAASTEGFSNTPCLSILSAPSKVSSPGWNMNLTVPSSVSSLSFSIFAAVRSMAP